MPKVKLSKYGRTLTGEANCPPGAVKVRNSVRAASYCRKKPVRKVRMTKLGSATPGGKPR